MQQYIARRLLLSIPVLLIVAVTAFGLMRLVPGSVLTAMIMEAEAGGGGGEEALAREDELKKELGLDRPLPVQFATWIAGVVRGDFGDSLWTGRPAWSQFIEAAPVTLELGAMALFFGAAIAIPVGILSAVRQDTVPDYIGRLVAIAGISMPSFWLGTMAVTFPAIWFKYQPPIGYRSPFDDPWGNFQQFIFPALIMGFNQAATTMRMLRSTMLEVLRQDYIRTAWAKGLRERVVIYRHALKNALIPVVTIFGARLAFIMGGTVIMELLFTIPGVGSLTYNAIQVRDYIQIQTNVLLLSMVVVFGNLVTDLTYAWLDPRIRYR